MPIFMIEKITYFKHFRKIDDSFTINEDTIKNSGIAFVDIPPEATEPEQEEKKEKLSAKERVKTLLKSVKSNLWR